MKPVVWSMLDVQVHGKEHVDDLNGAFIAVANHSSHLDTPLIYGALPPRLSKRMSAGAAADYFFDHWWKAAPTSLFFNAFPVDRRGQRKRKGLAGSLLSNGVPLLLFPEGTRSRNGAMGPFNPGSAALCISRNVPCLPIALVGAFSAMPSDGRMPIQGRPPVHVVIGRPLSAMPGEIAHQFNDRIRRQIVQLHDSTAKAYGLKTLAEFERSAALEAAKRAEELSREPKEKRRKPSRKDKPSRYSATPSDQQETPQRGVDKTSQPQDSQAPKPASTSAKTRTLVTPEHQDVADRLDAHASKREASTVDGDQSPTAEAEASDAKQTDQASKPKTAKAKARFPEAGTQPASARAADAHGETAATATDPEPKGFKKYINRLFHRRAKAKE
ncbi:MAG: 1-acyl-sn-glycerol-3-phosphate acyltransferase [Propionibacterium sp.]|nr:MAG: 1-acyl-sn-glycerol-3-phosphate acyltransferase [Propionibacterium sp.]